MATTRDILYKYADPLEAWLAEPEAVCRAILEGEPQEDGADWDTPTLPNDKRSVTDYACLILDRIARERKARAAGQIDMALRLTAELAYLIGEAGAKTEWRNVATVGARVVAGAKNGPKMKKILNAENLRQRNKFLRRAVKIEVDARKANGMEGASIRAVLNSKRGKLIGPPEKDWRVPESLRGAQKAYRDGA